MKPTAYGREIAGRWLLVLICLVLGTGAAAVYTWQSPSQYTSRVTVFFSIDPQAATKDTGTVFFAMAPTADFARFARSDAVVARVTGRVGGGVGVDALAEAVVVDAIADTTLIRITATDHDAQRARDIAAAYAEVVSVESTDLVGPKSALVARIAEYPEVADRPEPRPWWRNLAVGAGVGLLVGLVLAGARAARAA